MTVVCVYNRGRALAMLWVNLLIANIVGGVCSYTLYFVEVLLILK